MHIARDGEVFKIGAVTIEVLHTPGHTLESSCYLSRDENGKGHCIFTGDTLFVGDVGRPDLAQKSEELTMNDLAGLMYESLQKKMSPCRRCYILSMARVLWEKSGSETFTHPGEERNQLLFLKNKPEFKRP